MKFSLLCIDTALSQSSIGAQYSKQNMINFSQCLAELAQKFKFLLLAVLRSDSIKRNYGGLIFNFSCFSGQNSASLEEFGVHLFFLSRNIKKLQAILAETTFNLCSQKMQCRWLQNSVSMWAEFWSKKQLNQLLLIKDRSLY